jgi:hypothetical protein
MMATIREGVYVTDEIWQFMKSKGLNDAHLDTGVQAAGTAEVTGRTYYSVPTPVRNAMEVWGIVWRAEHNLETALVGASTSEQQWADGYFVVTYTQPEPPATNNTTDAVVNGNLAFRNWLFLKAFADIVSISQPATQNAEVTKNKEVSQGYMFFDVPLRIVLSQLEIQFVIENIANATDILYRFVADVLYRFVQVSDAEYSNLAALASGQAVLTEVLVA